MEDYFYRIPASLVENGEHEKAVLYGCIGSLCRKKGYCWASNKFLAKKMGLRNPGHISQYVQELIRDGWIKTEIHENRRKIWLMRDYSGKELGIIRNNRSLSSGIPKDSTIMSIKNSTIKDSTTLDDIKKELERKFIIT